MLRKNQIKTSLGAKALQAKGIASLMFTAEKKPVSWEQNNKTRSAAGDL